MSAKFHNFAGFVVNPDDIYYVRKNSVAAGDGYTVCMKTGETVGITKTSGDILVNFLVTTVTKLEADNE